MINIVPQVTELVGRGYVVHLLCMKVGHLLYFSHR